MNCPNCGSEVPANAKFCGECGRDTGFANRVAEPAGAMAGTSSGSTSATAIDSSWQPVATAREVGAAATPSTNPPALRSWETAPAQTAPPSYPGGPNNSSWQLQNNVNTTVNVGGPNIVIAQRKTGPGLFVRAIWFVFLGSPRWDCSIASLR
jgi:hypothetical protein